MRQSFLLLLAAFLVTTSFVSAPFAKSSKLTVEVKFINVVEGYDHINKNKVWIDDDEDHSVWSTTGLESETQTATLSLSRGTHTVHLINYAKYEGDWEAHTEANSYSIDVTLDDEYNFKKKAHKISIVVDIDKVTKSVKFK